MLFVWLDESQEAVIEMECHPPDLHGGQRGKACTLVRPKRPPPKFQTASPIGNSAVARLRIVTRLCGPRTVQSSQHPGRLRPGQPSMDSTNMPCLSSPELPDSAVLV